jgi:alkaline phosphatase
MPGFLRQYGFLLLMGLFCSPLWSQTIIYSVANAHSHNDYENPIPFHTAYNAGFGSIEADIFLQNDELIVAHDSKELRQHRTLVQYYILPLLSEVQKSNGYAFEDSSKRLQMLIDIKTEAHATLEKLIQVLEGFPLLVQNRTLSWVITGNRPDPKGYDSYPSFIHFDGELQREYPPSALPRIAMMSDDFKRYSSWDATHEIPPADQIRLELVIKKAHQLGKPVRFWDAPDNKNAWKEFMFLQVDFINTDHIEDLKTFLESR